MEWEYEILHPDWFCDPHRYYNPDMEKCPLDTPVVLIDEYSNAYLGTITKTYGRLVRGECLYGNAELFYRNKIVAWEPYICKEQFLE